MKKKISDLIKKKNKQKIVSLTAYSKNVASILDNHCDIILVGDSLGSVLYNYKSTREVTLNTMIEHSKSVRMGIKKSLMIVDMPHNTYRNPKEAVKNAKQIMKKTKCDGVKLEGGKKIYETIKSLVKNKIPVMGHLGLVPRKSTWIGGLRAVGKTADEAYELFKKFKRLEDAGAFSAECEVIPENIMGEISKRTRIVTVSLGSGKKADVMYLFMNDICGEQEKSPRHAKAYTNLKKMKDEIEIERVKALKAFIKDSLEGKFPGPENSVNVSEEILENFKKKL